MAENDTSPELETETTGNGLVEQHVIGEISL